MDRREREALILRAAKDVFAARGYHRTGVSHIIKRAGIARGTFYLYFTSKHGLLERLLDDVMREIQARVRTITLGKDDPPPLFQLRANLSGVIAYLLRDRAMTRILLHHAVGLNPEIDKKLTAFEAKLMRTIEGSLRYGQEIGLVRPCDAGIVALCVLGMIKEVVRAASTSRRAGVGSDGLVDQILVAGLRGVLYETPKRERKREPARPKASLRLVKV
jgi:AcrR family transcriptional regulator